MIFKLFSALRNDTLSSQALTNIFLGSQKNNQNYHDSSYGHFHSGSKGYRDSDDGHSYEGSKSSYDFGYGKYGSGKGHHDHGYYGCEGVIIEGGEPIIGSPCDDILIADEETFTIVGQQKNDKLIGKDNDESLFGDFRSSDEAVEGEIRLPSLDINENTESPLVLGHKWFGNDYIKGGNGDDTIWGDGEIVDTTFAELVADKTVKIDYGNDKAYGESGTDTIYGDAQTTNVTFNMDSNGNTFIAKFGNDKAKTSTGEGTQNVYGDAKEGFTTIEKGASGNTVLYNTGNDYISVKETTNIESIEIFGDIAENITTFQEGNTDNLVEYRTGKDHMDLGTITVANAFNNFIAGDIGNSDNQNDARVSLGKSVDNEPVTNNTINYITNNDYISAEAINVSNTRTLTLSGDMSGFSDIRLLDGASDNKVLYSTGKDHIAVKTATLESGNLEIFGDISAQEIFFANVSVNRNNEVDIYTGKDTISLGKVVGNGGSLKVSGDISTNISTMVDLSVDPQNLSENNNITYITNNDKLSIKSLILDESGRASIVGDIANGASTRISGGNSDSNVTVKTGHDYFNMGPTHLTNSAFVLSGDIISSFFHANIDSADGNTIEYTLGNDHINLKDITLDATTFLSSPRIIIYGDSSNIDAAIEGSGAEGNKIIHTTGNDKIFIKSINTTSLDEQNLFILNTIDADVDSATTRYSQQAINNNIEYHTGADYVHIGEINLLANDMGLRLITGDAATSTTNYSLSGGLSSNNDTTYNMANDNIYIGSITTSTKNNDFIVLVSLISGDTLSSTTRISSSTAQSIQQNHDITYDTGNDTIHVKNIALNFENGTKAFITGDAGDISTTFQGSGDFMNNNVTYNLGDDVIKIKETSGEMPLIIFGDGGVRPSNTNPPEPIEFLNPIEILVQGEMNTITYHDGSDKLNYSWWGNYGKGSQVYYPDTIYKISPDSDLEENTLTVTRGNDYINVGKDDDVDVVVFQVLEIDENTIVYPGNDTVKHYDLGDVDTGEGVDVLRFIIFDTDNNGVDRDDLEALISDIDVNIFRTKIEWQDGSTTTLKGNYTDADWDNVNDFVNDTDHVEVFGIDDTNIPLEIV